MVWATGFRADYTWVDVPKAFDEQGRPLMYDSLPASGGSRHYGFPVQPMPVPADDIADIPSLDAVLNPEQHDYLFFCAKPDDSGTHARPS